MGGPGVPGSANLVFGSECAGVGLGPVSRCGGWWLVCRFRQDTLWGSLMSVEERQQEVWSSLESYREL